MKRVAPFATVVMSALTGALICIVIVHMAAWFNPQHAADGFAFKLLGGLGVIVGGIAGGVAIAAKRERSDVSELVDIGMVATILAPVIIGFSARTGGFEYRIARDCPAETEGRVISGGMTTRYVVGDPSSSETTSDFDYLFLAGNEVIRAHGMGGSTGIDADVYVRFNPDDPRNNYGILHHPENVWFWHVATGLTAICVGSYWSGFRVKPIVACLTMSAVAFGIGSWTGGSNAAAAIAANRFYHGPSGEEDFYERELFRERMLKERNEPVPGS